MKYARIRQVVSGVTFHFTAGSILLSKHLGLCRRLLGPNDWIVNPTFRTVIIAAPTCEGTIAR